MKKVTRSEQNVKVDTGVQVDTGAQVQVYTVMQVQTQYIFAVYCIVHEIPFWLDPKNNNNNNNNNNISIPKTAHFVNSRSKNWGFSI